MAENNIIRRHLMTADTGSRKITSVQAHEIRNEPEVRRPKAHY